jgi:hypothetical protein
MPSGKRATALLPRSLVFAAFLAVGYGVGRALFPAASSLTDAPLSPTPESAPPEPPNPADAEIAELFALAPEAFPAMFNTIANDEGDGSSQGLRMRMLFARWAATAPEEGFAVVRAFEEGEWMHTFVEEWALVDPAGAEAMLVRTSGDEDMKYEYNALAKALVERDPEAYFEMRKRCPEFKGMAESDAFGELAKTNPARAAEVYGEFEFDGIEDRSQAVRRLAREWAKQNPNAALDWAWGLKSDQGREYALNAAFEGLAERDPHEAAKALAEFTLASGEKVNLLENLPSSLEGAISSIVGQLAKEDLGAAMRWLDENVENRAHSMLEHVAKYLPTDVTSLYAALSTVENPEFVRMLLFNATVIPATDSASYARQAAALPAGAVRDALLGQALATWARSDLASVSAFINREAPALASDTAFLQNLLNNVTPAQSEQALALVKTGAPASLPPDFLKNVAIRNPAALAETLPSMPEGAGRIAATQALASQWALSAPTTAAQWARGLTGADAEAAQGILAAAWARWDSFATSQWIADLPRGAARDGAVTALIAEVAPDEPDSAFAWAVTLEDAVQRGTGLQLAFEAWRDCDPVRADAALRAAALTPLERARLATITARP